MNVQDGPVQEGSDDASIDEKIAGLAEQIRGDADLGHVDAVRTMARQRLEDSGLPVDDATVDAVVRAVRST